MEKKTAVVGVKQKEENPVSTEVLAVSIVLISHGMKKLMTGGLTRDGIAALVKDSTRVPKKTTMIVMNAIADLSRQYTTKAVVK